jgi:hypothetical protein
VPPISTGLEKLLDDRARLEGAAAAGDPGSDRMVRTLCMQRQLQDIAAAQAAEIAAATAELTKLQQRCFPCLPAVGSGNLASGVGAGAHSSVQCSMASAAAAGMSLAVAGGRLIPGALAGAGRTAAAVGPAGHFGGGVVASGGGSFAPTGSRGRVMGRLPAAAGPDAKPVAAAGAGRVAGAARSLNAGSKAV